MFQFLRGNGSSSQNFLYYMRLNRYHILLLFIIFSIIYLFLLIELAIGVFLRGIDNPLTVFGTEVTILPYFLALFVFTMVGFAAIGLKVSQRRNLVEVKKGFKYSLFYSALLVISYIVFLIWFLNA
jgi:hypothetical protein